MATENAWWVYMIETQEGPLYTGITTDVTRRFEQHLSKKGAKYFYARTPKHVVYQEACANRSEASKREHEIKQLTLKQKIQMIQAHKITRLS